jgi:pyruvate dehydrogenase E1 component alpha subunit
MAEIPLEMAVEIYRRMCLIRRFEDRLYQMFLQGLVPGTLHQYQGQEAIAAGVCSTLRKDDLVFSTHRPVGHAIAKGVPVRAIAAEIWGKSTGCAAGKGGQMHLVEAGAGMAPSNAIVGANLPIAVGAALGFRLQNLDRIAVCFFGDGATNSGAFHEGMNLAAIKAAPVVFVCENNQYAASTHISKTVRIEELSIRAGSYGMPGYTLDGMDPAKVYSSALEAVRRARQGEGPTFLEYRTYRFMGHSRGDPGGYRTKSETENWRLLDPLPAYRQVLLNVYLQDPAELDRIESLIESEIDEAVEFALNSPLPGPDEVLTGVFAQGGEEQ